MGMEHSLITLENVKVYFKVKRSGNEKNQTIKAVDDVSFDVIKNETLGIVGESGCGKSTVARAILRLVDITEGSISFNGNDLASRSNREMKTVRKDMQMIFQDPYASLNPRRTIASIVGESLKLHTDLSRDEILERVGQLLLEVGLRPEYMTRYPHEFSGGQRQRISIARSIALNPAFIACDEAVSALDVSVQAQVLNLLEDLKKKYHLTYLFISHDLSVIKHISDRIIVMYLGKIVEIANKQDLFENPAHPYTQLLLDSIPVPDPDEKHEGTAFNVGEIPSALNIPSGCRFRTRCKHVTQICIDEEPQKVVISEGHICYCHLYQ
jgi:oligopeptide/dipeptide ABC transporter ATP-binding protein